MRAMLLSRITPTRLALRLRETRIVGLSARMAHVLCVALVAVLAPALQAPGTERLFNVMWDICFAADAEAGDHNGFATRLLRLCNLGHCRPLSRRRRPLTSCRS